jgi:hypothetical protein
MKKSSLGEVARRVSASIVFIIACAVAQPGNAALITFDDFPVDTILTNQLASDGVRLSLIDSPTQPGPRVVPYSGPCCPGGLPPPNVIGLTGHTIVFGQVGASEIYDVHLDFTRPMRRVSFYLLDAEDSEPFTAIGRVRFPGPDAFIPATSSVVLGLSVNGPVRFVELDAPAGSLGIVEMTIDVTNRSGGGLSGGPGYLDNLSLEPIPSPGGLAAIAPALLLAWVARRRGMTRC